MITNTNSRWGNDSVVATGSNSNDCTDNWVILGTLAIHHANFGLRLNAIWVQFVKHRNANLSIFWQNSLMSGLS